ncbi:hypothetical protein FIBSPDRAFT_1047496 [Athelia psychrophila]|uniref:CFEM domain-containing protein n=1 Tax=Athelia psychrophila TaxID=1759441 RepID=A0A165Y5F6_9AGAM|nr:hypothetical protein FIBSPDRAFT_802281 [Fibularhizoctonia sp. CBS 109695]KZP16399.1 hypothetical protein FIBSPDRAFT_1047496 [Fibularhizoctonia sp. CBS 109695]
MQFSMFLIALFSVILSGSASASTFYARQSLPSCAVPCIENANYGTCGQQDNVCMCNDDNFIDTTTACIESTCSGSDLINAEQYSQAICRSVGVTLTSSVILTGTWASIAASETSADNAPAPTAAPSGTATANAAVSVRSDVLAGTAAFGLVLFALVL